MRLINAESRRGGCLRLLSPAVLAVALSLGL
jgi:hypothetical protein